MLFGPSVFVDGRLNAIKTAKRFRLLKYCSIRSLGFTDINRSENTTSLSSSKPSASTDGRVTWKKSQKWFCLRSVTVQCAVYTKSSGPESSIS